MYQPTRTVESSIIIKFFYLNHIWCSLTTKGGGAPLHQPSSDSDWSRNWLEHNLNTRLDGIHVAQTVSSWKYTEAVFLKFSRQAAKRCFTTVYGEWKVSS